MKAEEYIATGILESYVLGELSPEERKEVERMAIQHPEIGVELSQLQQAMEGYVLSESVLPRSEVKTKLFASLEGKQAQQGKVVALHSRPWKLATGLAAGLALLASGLAIYLGMQWGEAKDRITQLENEQTVLAHNYQTSQKDLLNSQSQLSLLQDTSVQRVSLKAQALDPSASALVYWNKATQEVYLDLKQLPQTAENQQYQLWALVDGKPVDAGVFDVRSGLQKMKNMAQAQAFAITLEKKGGSPTPTLTAMYLLGNV